MLRQMLLVLIAATSIAGCAQDDSPVATGYRTNGTAKLQVCKGAGIEKCEYEPTDVPERIDLQDPDWNLLRAEQKSSTRTMCYLDLPGGPFTKRKLMFDCEPIYEPVPTTDRMNPENRRDALVKNLANMAEAAATFEVCRNFYKDDAETWLAWNRYLIALRAAAEQMTPGKDDAALYLAFEAHRGQLVDSEEFRSETLEYMENCDATSFEEAGDYIRKSEDVAKHYLT